MRPREIARSKDVTTNSPQKKAGTAGLRPWEIDKYIYKEEPRDDQRSSHGDPRLEFALQSHGQHPDSDFIPSDSDHEALHPAFGFGTTPDLSASTSSASDQGTLAGRLSVELPQSTKEGGEAVDSKNMAEGAECYW